MRRRRRSQQQVRQRENVQEKVGRKPSMQQYGVKGWWWVGRQAGRRGKGVGKVFVGEAACLLKGGIDAERRP